MSGRRYADRKRVVMDGQCYDCGQPTGGMWRCQECRTRLNVTQRAGRARRMGQSQMDLCTCGGSRVQHTPCFAQCGHFKLGVKADV